MTQAKSHSILPTQWYPVLPVEDFIPRGEFTSNGYFIKRAHQKLKLYEIRRRGELMSDGDTVHAETHEMARLIPKGGQDTDWLIIEAEPGKNFGDWYLIAEGGYSQRQNIEIDGQIIHPFDHGPGKRLALAKACEKQFQSIEIIKSTKFANFEEQAKKYEKEPHQKGVIIIVAECMKECAIAETATLNREKRKAKVAISTAKKSLQSAMMYAEKTKSDSIEKAILQAQEQIDTSIKKIKEYRQTDKSTSIAELMGMA